MAVASGQRTGTLSQQLQRALDDYVGAKQTEIGKDNPVWQLFAGIAGTLAQSEPLRASPTVRVDWSVGRGNWAAVPWIALLDSRETASTRHGVYVVYLFREDGSGVYLTLNQGVTKPNDEMGWTAARDFLRNRANEIRHGYPELVDRGFAVDDGIDLRATGELGSRYEASTIAYKLYETRRVPDEAGLLADVGSLLDVYVKYVGAAERQNPLGPSSWIFQANPNLYDIRGSLKAVPEMTWLVRQHHDQIKAGDRVFIWESGPVGGILATAKVLADPTDMVDEAQMERFFRDREKFEGVQPRVRLRIERVLDSPIRKADLLGHALLRNVPILKAPQGTNFPLTLDQARALSELAGESTEQDSGVFDRASGVTVLTTAVAGEGFVFEPWQIAAYVTALRTKPFVILAGVTGTGKSKLPALAAAATGGVSSLIPVRPDWTDSADLLGYVDIKNQFRPGRLLKLAKEAEDNRSKHFVCVLDEMNLARVEHYFAEALSAIEDRRPIPEGGFESSPLLGQRLVDEATEWSAQSLPPNLAIVGTVNMDETTHGFSRKVLDRAFTLELSEIDLSKGLSSEGRMAVSQWPVSAWYPRATRVSELRQLSADEEAEVTRAIRVLTELNSFLVHAQLQLGYRTRDEVALFLLHARDVRASFSTSVGDPVDPLDLAIHMKVLPRLIGGSGAIRRALLQLLGWAQAGSPLETEEQARDLVQQWDSTGRLGGLPGSSYPRTAARLCLMWDRLQTDGFTSFWL